MEAVFDQSVQFQPVWQISPKIKIKSKYLLIITMSYTGDMIETAKRMWQTSRRMRALIMENLHILIA